MSTLKKDLNDFSTALRHFHSGLLELTRLEYEIRTKTKPNAFTLFHLVTQEPSFQWLRPLSGLMATLDEVTDAKAPLGSPQVRDLERAISELFSPLEPKYGEFRLEYERFKSDARVRQTERIWREKLLELRGKYLEGDLN